MRLVHSLGAKTEQAKAQIWGVGQGWVCPCSRAATEESFSPERDLARDPGLSVQDQAFAQFSLGLFQTAARQSTPALPRWSEGHKVLQPTVSKAGDQTRIISVGLDTWTSQHTALCPAPWDIRDRELRPFSIVREQLDLARQWVQVMRVSQELASHSSRGFKASSSQS